MPPTPESTGPEDGVSRISAWAEKHLEHLSFDETLGHFVLDTEPDPENPPSPPGPPPRPAVPFPGWRGPVPKD